MLIYIQACVVEADTKTALAIAYNFCRLNQLLELKMLYSRSCDKPQLSNESLVFFMYCQHSDMKNCFNICNPIRLTLSDDVCAILEHTDVFNNMNMKNEKLKKLFVLI